MPTVSGGLCQRCSCSFDEASGRPQNIASLEEGFDMTAGNDLNSTGRQLVDSAVSILVSGYCVHGRGRSLIPFASRPTTSAMRAARRSGRRVVASM